MFPILKHAFFIFVSTRRAAGWDGSRQESFSLGQLASHWIILSLNDLLWSLSGAFLSLSSNIVVDT